MTTIHGVWDQVERRWAWYVETGDAGDGHRWRDQAGRVRKFSSADAAQRAWWRHYAKQDRRSAKVYP